MEEFGYSLSAATVAMAPLRLALEETGLSLQRIVLR